MSNGRFKKNNARFLSSPSTGSVRAVTAALEAHPLITIEREEVRSLDQLLRHSGRTEGAIRNPGANVASFDPLGSGFSLREPRNDEGDALPESVIFATGPLTSPALADSIRNLTGEDSLAFFDAIAPIVHADSIDFDIAWKQSRYDKEGPGGDKAAYVNCPMDQGQYEAFIAALLAGQKTEFREWEKNSPYFEGCLPIEVMAERGAETLRLGPMKPVGLADPRTGRRPYAVVQLRQDHRLGTLFNMGKIPAGGCRLETRIEAANERLAKKGMRVLGVAFRLLDSIPEVIQTDLEQDLTIVDLFGMIDPPRNEVKAAIATCRAAGIRPVMITGDHPLTAREIARQLGILEEPLEKARVLTGQELDRLDEAEFKRVAAEVSVFARVAPNIR